ncbi:MAG: NUDIX domain-containing protein [Gammaproteobacteria bacterium]|nr:NUDIX domain-containing protein [Gammaproteobacteria bacterium]
MQPLSSDNIRLAATILLVRDAASGPEVFMLQRPAGVDFPDLHVFPGGKVDAADFAPQIITDFDDLRASRKLGLAAGGLRYWVAAIRECFEECGVLLADRDGEVFAPGSEAEVARFSAYRHSLVTGEIDFASLCGSESLTIRAGRAHYFSHWITPEFAPRRFDTRFFIAEMPAGQFTDGHAWETADEAWVAPGQALEYVAAGRWQMIAPTLTTLRSIVEYPDVASILAAVAVESHLPELTAELLQQGMHPLR